MKGWVSSSMLHARICKLLLLRVIKSFVDVCYFSSHYFPDKSRIEHYYKIENETQQPKTT